MQAICEGILPRFSDATACALIYQGETNDTTKKTQLNFLVFSCMFLQTLVGTFFVFFYSSDFSYLFSIHRVSWAVCFQLQSYQRFHTTAWTNHQGQCTRTLIFSLPLFLFASRVARHVPAVSWQHICSYAVDDWYAAIPIQHGSSMPGYRSSLA